MGRTRDETGQRQTSESTAIRLAFQKDHSGNSLYDGIRVTAKQVMNVIIKKYFSLGTLWPSKKEIDYM